jgi:hypothetical protein
MCLTDTSDVLKNVGGKLHADIHTCVLVAHAGILRERIARSWLDV